MGKISAKYFKIIALVVLILYHLNLISQIVSVQAKIDSQRMTIGDQVKLTLEVRKNKDIAVRFPIIEEKLTDDIEIISISAIDSSWLKEDKKVLLRQTLLITAFDSGTYDIPPFKFVFQNSTLTDTVQTMATSLEVLPFPIDTTGTIRDIKSVDKAPLTVRDFIPYLFVILIVTAIVVLIVYYTRKRKKNEPIFFRPKPIEPAHVIADRELDRLKAEKLWQKGQTKLYYSRLTEIIRKYIEQRFNIMAMEQTTDEILFEFDGQKILDKDDRKVLTGILQLADLVKFAKADPLPDENEENLENSYLFVKKTKYEAVTEPDSENAELHNENVTV